MENKIRSLLYLYIDCHSTRELVESEKYEGPVRHNVTIVIHKL